MPNPTTTRPETTEHAPDFGKYIQLVPDGDIQLFLAAQLKDLLKLLTGLSEKDSLVRHAPTPGASSKSSATSPIASASSAIAPYGSPETTPRRYPVSTKPTS
jgi:hypothetical protein